MRVLISGGSGMIGRALTESLTADGHEVIILSRKPEKVQGFPQNVKIIAWDGVTGEGWSEWVEGADAIVNLAGSSIAGENPLKMRWTSKRKSLILRSRLNAGRAISEAITNAQRKPGVLIQSSAIGAYGPGGNDRLTEDSPEGDDFLADVCRQWEASTRDVEDLGVRRVVIRTGLVFNSKKGIFPLLKLPFTFFVGGPLGDGKQYMSWISTHDVVAAIRFLIDSDRASGVYNLTAPHPVTNNEFSKTLGRIMKRPSAIRMPAWVMQLALGEVSTLALDSQQVLPERLMEEGFTFELPTLEIALTDLLTRNLHFTHSFQVEATLPSVADFHRDTKVLKQLTPPPIFVQFKDEVESMNEGTRVDFVLWFGPFPVHWSAKHYAFDPPNGFRDNQVKGPFDFWDHRHSFIPIDDRTTAVIDDIEARYGRSPYHAFVSRFMWLTLPILFSFRSWQTRRLLQQTDTAAERRE
jgi:uncharacterized protein (TIGR01777 family)